MFFVFSEFIEFFILVFILVGCLYINIWDVFSRLIGIFGEDFIDRNSLNFGFGFRFFICFLSD